jgi:large subunit ribosomal protein L25
LKYLLQSRETSDAILNLLWQRRRPSLNLNSTTHTMASTSRYIKLATRLPPQLTRFFARYPPRSILDSTTQTPNSLESPLTASSTDATASIPNSSADFSESAAAASPFRAQKHPITGKWHDPVFSLRRQAELVKLAREHGVEELLPHSIKGTAERLRRREENGLRVKGTGIGQKVKGKEWERTLKGRYVFFHHRPPCS